MKNKVGIIGIIGVVTVALAGGAYALYSANQPDTSSNNSKQSTESTKPSESNGDEYANLKGDKFDEAFIAGMLAHHEGAVNMAEQAQAVTARDEIRELAGNITAFQSQEMITMRDWQKQWGYEETNSGGHMSHGGEGMDMAGEMNEMMSELQGLTGEAHDKKFLQLMIEHHEQAIEMAEPAETNAKHEEIKQLARQIIEDQTREINQMKEWQSMWGY